MSCPDAETYLTGIDFYDNHRQCRLKLCELYPELGYPVPETDDPIPRPTMGKNGISANMDKHTVRWGAGETVTFEHGEKYFKCEEDVFAFEPLEHADMTGWRHVVNSWDFTSEEVIYNKLRANYPEKWIKAPDYSCAAADFYNTMFMWPMLTFGWEMFLACCLDDRFERIMDGFAEINRRVFRAMARLPVNFAVCHDDIAMTRGMVCSKKWMHKYIYPRYEEYWSMLKDAGITVIFMMDGNMDECADDIIACGAQGIITEPHADFKAIARRHPDKFIAGDGDVHVLYRNDRAEISNMVDSMLETAKLSSGYMLCIGNQIPWDVPPEAVKIYLDLCDERAYK
jgi:hypothetical protein